MAFFGDLLERTAHGAQFCNLEIDILDSRLRERLDVGTFPSSVGVQCHQRTTIFNAETEISCTIQKPEGVDVLLCIIAIAIGPPRSRRHKSDFLVVPDRLRRKTGLISCLTNIHGMPLSLLCL